jgi:hypothetical protein
MLKDLTTLSGSGGHNIWLASFDRRAFRDSGKTVMT